MGEGHWAMLPIAAACGIPITRIMDDNQELVKPEYGLEGRSRQD